MQKKVRRLNRRNASLFIYFYKRKGSVNKMLNFSKSTSLAIQDTYSSDFCFGQSTPKSSLSR